MGFLSPYSGTRKVTVGDPERGYWVELREVLSQGAKEKAEQALQGRQRVNGGEVVMQMDVARYRQLMVEASIVTWNLDDDNGKIWPVNLSSVQRLPGNEFDRLWSMVDEMNTPVDPKERRQFPDEGDDGDSIGDERPAVAGYVPAPSGTVETPWHAAGGPGSAPVA